MDAARVSFEIIDSLLIGGPLGLVMMLISFATWAGIIYGTTWIYAKLRGVGDPDAIGDGEGWLCGVFGTLVFVTLIILFVEH
jgi:hypothetical protein